MYFSPDQFYVDSEQESLTTKEKCEIINQQLIQSQKICDDARKKIKEGKNDWIKYERFRKIQELKEINNYLDEQIQNRNIFYNNLVKAFQNLQKDQQENEEENDYAQFQMALADLRDLYQAELIQTQSAEQEAQKVNQRYLQAKSEQENLKKMNQNTKNEINLLKEKLAQEKLRSKKLKDQYHYNQKKLEEIRDLKKRSNNQLQELRGNIRVFCRIRPSLKLDQPKISYNITDSSLAINRKTIDINGKQKSFIQTFVFEKIFDQHTTQENIFQQMMDLIQNSLDGKNVCIFAYGQTGSGKTYTMNGSFESEETLGLIPRTLNKIFSGTNILRQQGYQTKVSISVSEIYNGDIIDLLDNSQQMNKSRGLHQKVDLRFVQVESLEQALILLDKANEKRSTASTECNAHSSRSHLIFTINNSFKLEAVQGKEIRSNLVLVDLAGSERLKESKAEGERKKQASFINLSLTELGKVMRQIKAGGNPSYRNSELTKSLQPYLQGDGKAVMFVNVSPDLTNEQITIQSLKFAEGVRECKIKQKK